MKLPARWTLGGILKPAGRESESAGSPQEFVDIHSHILWGLDDGAPNLTESLAMLKMAAESGTTDIVATPHASSRYKFDPSLVSERVEELRTHLPTRLHIHTGCDFHLNVGNINDALENPRKYTINGLIYLMVEFPDFQIPASSEEILERLVNSGINPVITHPERNSILQTATERLRDWVAMGCLIQVTAQSLGDRFGKAAQQSAQVLLKEDLVHFIASDAHDTVHRPPRLDGAWQSIEREFGTRTARRLFIDNPRAVILGNPLPDEGPPTASDNEGTGRDR